MSVAGQDPQPPRQIARRKQVLLALAFIAFGLSFLYLSGHVVLSCDRTEADAFDCTVSRLALGHLPLRIQRVRNVRGVHVEGRRRSTSTTSTSRSSRLHPFLVLETASGDTPVVDWKDELQEHELLSLRDGMAARNAQVKFATTNRLEIGEAGGAAFLGIGFLILLGLGLDKILGRNNYDP